jgi:hypothetical protein
MTLLFADRIHGCHCSFLDKRLLSAPRKSHSGVGKSPDWIEAFTLDGFRELHVDQIFLSDL